MMLATAATSLALGACADIVQEMEKNYTVAGSTSVVAMAVTCDLPTEQSFKNKDAARIKSARGRFAKLAYGTEDYMRDKIQEIENENRHGS